MAFARKAKKKTRTSKSSSRKNQADPDFFNPRPHLFPKTPLLSSLCSPLSRAAALYKYEQHRLPVKHEEAVNRNGGNHRPIRARVSRFQKTFFTLHRRPQPTKWQTFTGEGF